MYKSYSTFGKDTIPTAEDLSGKYYEPTNNDTFPAVDSLSPQGMFHFTVAAQHSIRGGSNFTKIVRLTRPTQTLLCCSSTSVCNLYKAEFQRKSGSGDVTEVGNLKQYVLELPIKQNIGWCIFLILLHLFNQSEHFYPGTEYWKTCTCSLSFLDLNYDKESFYNVADNA
jgi:hypothetical protein